MVNTTERELPNPVSGVADARRGGRIAPGTVLGERALTTIHGETVLVPDRDRLVHLQFRRFAGCPVCNMHLRSFVRRHEEIRAASIHEVVVFHSSVDELLDHAEDLPFSVIADPDKRLYREFGVEASPRALLDPRAWGPVLWGVLQSLFRILRRKERSPALRPDGGGLGLPADFLITPGGRVVASGYGVHAYDQWSVEEVLDFASIEGAGAR